MNAGSLVVTAWPTEGMMKMVKAEIIIKECRSGRVTFAVTDGTSTWGETATLSLLPYDKLTGEVVTQRRFLQTEKLVKYTVDNTIYTSDWNVHFHYRGIDMPVNVMSTCLHLDTTQGRYLIPIITNKGISIPIHPLEKENSEYKVKVFLCKILYQFPLAPSLSQ